ncbi:nucleotide cyclase [Dunaliella salina]|nr:nucleotide cyclase [Dunaliella salina]|eukprot:KAF5843347.1 nucleotide cyclase [Dunaliella salina]
MPARLTPSLTKGTSLFESQFKEIQAGYGQGLADLVAQCCATEKHDRPSFVQIHSRIEELTPEIIQVATQAHQEKELTKPPSFAKKATVDELLYELFPSQVADALKSGRHPDPEPYSEVSLFFSDVCGYTNICSILQPHDVMNMLHRLYSRFDTLAQELCLFKVETVGDAYLCVANLKHPQPEVHARLMAEFAFGCLEAANNELICPSRPELGHIHIRVGIHAGPVMGAVVGTLNRRFGIFGDAVNVASRMESSSIKDHIQCSAPFMKLLQDQWPECADLAVPQGARAIKSKGTMNTFMLFPLQKRAEATLLKQHSSKRRVRF